MLLHTAACSMFGRPRLTRGFPVVLVALVVSLPCLAQGASDRAAGSSQDAALTQPGQASPGYALPQRVPAELIEPNRPEAIILPSEPQEQSDKPIAGTQGVIGQVTPTPRLLPEGYAIADRPAQIETGTPWWTVVAEDVEGLPDAPPLRILPNRQLMLLERIAAAGQLDQTFRVTGRITEYLGENYVLLEQIEAPPAGAAQISDDDRAPEGASSRADTDATSPQPPVAPTAEQIIERLMQDAPGRVLRGEPTTQPVSQPPPMLDAETTSDGDAAATVQAEGTLLPEFPARVVRRGDSWVLVRESRGERPVRTDYPVLPNRLLELIVSASQGGARSLVFLVSGELTEYRGQNYLLVRKVLIRRDLGNLR